MRDYAGIARDEKGLDRVASEIGRLEFGPGVPLSEMLVATEDTVYMCVQHEILVVDVRQPSAPVEVASMPVPPNQDMGSANPMRCRNSWTSAATRT